MDPDLPPRSRRKLKFAPRGPHRRTPKSVASKISMQIQSEAEDDAAAEAEQEALSRKVKEYLTRRRKKLEKSSVQVAFSHGTASSEIRTFDNRSDATDVEDSGFDDRQKQFVTSSSTRGFGGFEDFAGLANAFSAIKKKKKRRKYREPWDYHFSYYPTTLPLRRPCSGDQELLDKAEFDHALEYDETTLHFASDLGLLDQNKSPRMLFLQFPANLPLGSLQTSENAKTTADRMKTPQVTNQKQAAGSHLPPKVLSPDSKGKEIVGSTPKLSGISTGAKGKETSGSRTNPVKVYPSERVCSLEKLPKGHMGKMLVYKSGAVKFKLGDILYDVSPGSDCMFAQSVVAINAITKHCVELGELKKRAVVSPDIDVNMIDFR